MTGSASPGVELRRLDPDDWIVWRDVRLRALNDAPGAFGSTAAFWEHQPEDRWRRRLELISMWVAPAARGRGVGESLVSAVVDWAGTVDALSVVLSVRTRNDPAIALYERCGFRRTIEPAEEGEVRMRRSLRT